MFGGTIKMTPTGVLVLLFTTVLLFLYYFRSGGSKTDDYHVSLRKLLAVSLCLAEKGGVAVKEVRESQNLKEKSKGKTKEGADELRTEADIRSHQIIASGLAHLYPNLLVLSEEHDAPPALLPDVHINNGADHDEIDEVPDEEVSVKDIAVWVDPLDATQEFTENLSQYVTVMICIAVKGKPMIGIIHQPFTKETVWGWVNRASSKTLKAAAPRPADQPRRIIVSRSHAGKVTAVAMKAFGNKTQVIPAGGAGYKTLEVIRGHADAYVHTSLIKKWDICAANAILATVHGQMTTLDGRPISYGGEDSAENNDGVVATLIDQDKYTSLLKNTKT